MGEREKVIPEVVAVWLFAKRKKRKKRTLLSEAVYPRFLVVVSFFSRFPPSFIFALPFFRKVTEINSMLVVVGKCHLLSCMTLGSSRERRQAVPQMILFLGLLLLFSQNRGKINERN